MAARQASLAAWASVPTQTGRAWTLAGGRSGASLIVVHHTSWARYFMPIKLLVLRWQPCPSIVGLRSHCRACACDRSSRAAIEKPLHELKADLATDIRFPSSFHALCQRNDAQLTAHGDQRADHLLTAGAGFINTGNQFAVKF